MKSMSTVFNKSSAGVVTSEPSLGSLGSLCASEMICATDKPAALGKTDADGQDAVVAQSTSVKK